MRPLLDSRSLLIALAALFAVNLLVTNRSTPLWDQDEAAYAGFAYTMLDTGDWAIPEFTWSEQHRKPPLHFWAMAASMALLGENPFAVRLPSALAIAATCALLAWWGAAVFGRARALSAAVVLMTSLFGVFGKVAVTDGLLVLCETAAALALLRFLDAARLRWAVTLWVAVAAGLLVKGPPILILVGGMGVWLALFHPRRKVLLGLHSWFGLPLALLPLFAWGWVAWRADGGELVRWMVDWYVLRRTTGAVFGQTGPPGYFLVSFAVFFFPWVALLPAALVRTFRRVRSGDKTYLGLAGWLLAGWLFYEVLPSKLPAYVLGAYPALAVILADQALDLSAQRLRSSRLLQVGLVLQVLFGGALAAGLIAGAWLLIPGDVLTSLVVAGCIVAVTTALFGALALRGSMDRALISSMAGFLLFFMVAWLAAVPALRPRLGVTRMVADHVEAVAAPGATVLLDRNYRLPSLPLYLAWAGMEYRELGEDEVPREVLESGGGDVLIVAVAPSDFSDPGDGQFVDGWIPDKGVPVRFWIVTSREGP